MSYYNFLPPFLQAYPDSTGVTGQLQDITRINKYIPDYKLTFGSLIPLQVDSNNIPINVNGITGPTGVADFLNVVSYVGTTGQYGATGSYLNPVNTSAYSSNVNVNKILGITGPNVSTKAQIHPSSSISVTLNNNKTVGVTGLIGVTGPTGIQMIGNVFVSGYVGGTGRLDVSGSVGITGPKGITGTIEVTGFNRSIIGGGSGFPAAATPFMVTAYGQTTSGIIQFVLMKGSKLPPASNGNTGLASQYYFVSATDILDVSRVAQVYYTGTTGASGPTGQQYIKFYDAEKIKASPNSPITDFELFGYNGLTGSLGPTGYYRTWPSSDSNGKFSLKFNFIQNTAAGLFAGKDYNVYQIDTPTLPPYTHYTGYGPGYAININYAYAPITTEGNTPVVKNLTDNVTNKNKQKWTSNITLSIYNSSVINIQNYIDRTNVYGYIKGLSLSGNSFLNPTSNCSVPQECSNPQDSYFNNNYTTVQMGVANYLTYQFLPLSQLKSPPGAIITDVKNTSYSYYTLPAGITPTYTNLNNVNSTIPIKIQELISGNTGNTGFTAATTSILSSYLNSPNNSVYRCDTAVSLDKYCGFLDYYDSLFGIPYDYGTCGQQKGYCPNNQICVPNFDFLLTYNTTTTPPFQCVNPVVGISYDQMQSYLKSLAYNPNPNGNNTYPAYSLASPGQAPKKKTNKPSKTASTIAIVIAIVLVVILLIVIIVVLVKSFKSKNIAEKYKLQRIDFNE